VAITWTDFQNGESALSIRNKINTFNNSVVTENSSIVQAVNANVSSIATNTTNISNNTSAIANNTADITTNTASIAATALAVSTIQNKIDVFATLYGVYGTPQAYNLTTSYQDLDNFGASATGSFTASTVNGTLIPGKTGYYQVSLFFTGNTPESSEKVATVALIENSTVLMEGSTSFISDRGINVSFTGIFPLTAGNTYKIQIKSNTASTINITADNFSMHYVGV
jgi:hypothetical protein